MILCSYKGEDVLSDFVSRKNKYIIFYITEFTIELNDIDIINDLLSR